jgi:AcrR family transcriptional regulator
LKPDVGNDAKSTGGLRERKKDATRQALRAAALELFNERGFAGTSVDEIASRADVSRSTFFRYFGSKEDVFFAEGDVNGEIFVQMLLARPAEEAPIRAYEEALVALTKERVVEATRHLTRVSEELIRDDAALRLRRHREVERWTVLIGDALAQRDGRQTAGRADRVAAAVCLGVSEQVGREWMEVGGPDAVDAIRSAFAGLRRALG